MGSWEPQEVHAPRSSGHVPSQSSQQWPRSSDAIFDAGAEQLLESQPAFGPASHPQLQQLGMSPLLPWGAAGHRTCCKAAVMRMGRMQWATLLGLPELRIHRTSLRTVLKTGKPPESCKPSLYTGMDSPSCSYCSCPLPSCRDFLLIIKM